MSDLRDRDLLYARLREVLGSKPADILMQSLPPKNDLATRSDVRDLGFRIASLETRMDRLEAHMVRFDERLHEFHGAMRQQTRTFVLSSLGSSATMAAAIVTAAAIL